MAQAVRDPGHYGYLELAGVTVVPGSGFGTMGEGHVRIALVQSEARLAEAVERIHRSGILDRRVA
jgi:aspartate/methionine/tyrosine aminotransferase